MMWKVDGDSFFIGGAVFGFAVVLIGLFLPFPNQISFMLPIILSSCIILLGLICINIMEQGGYNGTR